MQRQIPVNLLVAIENWFDKCYTCVRWFSVQSNFFKLEIGIRQGGVLSPQFFAVYIDGIVDKVNRQDVGCFMHHVCVSIIIYADDILILAPSVTALQKLLLVVETELNSLGMFLNVTKSVCMRIGPRYQDHCANIVTSSGRELEWVQEIRYLGVYVASFCKFKCLYADAKKAFFRSFNAVYGRIGRAASEEVILSLVKAKCLPVLLYGLDACPVNATDTRSLDFTVNRILMKIFCTYSTEIIANCQDAFDFPPVHTLVQRRKLKFLRKFIASENIVCMLCSESAETELNIINRTELK